MIETYDRRETKGYIGEYETDGDCCSCSHYKNKLFCRHLLFFREQMALPMFETSMFHRIHLTEGTTGAIYDEDEQLVVIDNNDVTHHEPVSPGTAGLLLEEQEKKTRWSKQLKFNKAFDIKTSLRNLLKRRHRQRPSQRSRFPLSTLWSPVTESGEGSEPQLGAVWRVARSVT